MNQPADSRHEHLANKVATSSVDTYGHEQVFKKYHKERVTVTSYNRIVSNTLQRTHYGWFSRPFTVGECFLVLKKWSGTRKAFRMNITCF